MSWLTNFVRPPTGGEAVRIKKTWAGYGTSKMATHNLRWMTP